MKRAFEALDDLAWPVTPGDCDFLISARIASLIGIVAAAAWILANIVSIS